MPEAALFQISLHCDLADQHRKLDGNSTNALAEISGGEQSAMAWADAMGLDPNHPLRAEMLERQAWINVDGWQMQRAIEQFKQATKIRTENQNAGNTFAWRPILLNMQGEAMALHFLGDDGLAITLYQQLIDRINTPPKDVPHGTSAEREERLPNIYERRGDAHMFGPNRDYSLAAESYNKAIGESTKQAFDTSATMWVHLARMYYKYSLALTLSNEFEKLRMIITDSQNAAKALENKLQTQMADDEAFKKQQAAFALERQVAEAVFKLKEAEIGDTQVLETELKDLLQLITENTEATKVSRSNVEVLLLVFQQLFVNMESLMKESNASRALYARLMSFTRSMREGDKAIAETYLVPVFEAASIALKDYKTELEAVIKPKE